MQRVYYTATVDSIKAKALMDLAGLYAKSNPDTCIQLAKEALNISQQAKFKRGEVHSINVIGLAYYRKNDYDNALIYYEKVQKNIEILAPNPRCGLFLNLGNIYLKKLHYVQALLNYQKALKIYEAIVEKKILETTQNQIKTLQKESDIIVSETNNYTKPVTDTTDMSISTTEPNTSSLVSETPYDNNYDNGNLNKQPII